MARRTKKTKLSNFMVKVWLKAVGVWKWFDCCEQMDFYRNPLRHKCCLSGSCTLQLRAKGPLCFHVLGLIFNHIFIFYKIANAKIHNYKLLSRYPQLKSPCAYSALKRGLCVVFITNKVFNYTFRK
jgi:hypothetical protein